MREFVGQQTAKLLRKLSREVKRAAENQDEDAVHDLRVAIRRLNRCLRLFSSLYPGKSWKKVRRQLKTLMDAAGAVRDRDIAAMLLTKAGLKAGSPAFERLAEERREASEDLAGQLRAWNRRKVSKKWQAELGL
jgi:CHAD domain-containing protein